ncbi:MAG: hypothetical protein ABR573_09730 [Candidatus Dormibacteria bacterium]
MNKKEERQPRRLELNRETVRDLKSDELRQAAGGVGTNNSYNVICQLTYQPRCF